jgi:lysophospholipase L1-like esterase
VLPWAERAYETRLSAGSTAVLANGPIGFSTDKGAARQAASLLVVVGENLIAGARNPNAEPNCIVRMKIKRLVTLACVGALLIIAAAGYLHFLQSRPIGTGPAGPQVPNTVFSRTWSEKQFLLIGLGDSVTAGFGARHGYSYFDRLVTNPPEEFDDMRGRCLQTVLPYLKFTNLAVSGSTSSEHVAHQLSKLPNLSSNVVALVVMTTGGNDLIHNYGKTPPRDGAMFGSTWDQAAPWVTNFDQRLEGMVNQINGHFPAGCHIFLANIFDPTDGVGDTEQAGLPAWRDGEKIVAAYNDVIRRCAARHSFVHLVDFHEAFLGHGIHCAQFWSAHYDAKDPHYWYYVNLEDPNERGDDVIRRLFLLEFARTAEQLR